MGRLSPRERVSAACARRGQQAVVAGCVAQFRGDHSDSELLDILGPPTSNMRDRSSRADDQVWFRTWALRGLLWSFDGSGDAERVVIDACSDSAWRVREMACKVVARHQIAGAFEAIEALRKDDVERVRQCAQRALTVLVAHGR